MSTFQVLQKRNKTTDFKVINDLIFKKKTAVAILKSNRLYNFNGDLIGYLSSNQLYDKYGFIIGKLGKSVDNINSSELSAPSYPAIGTHETKPKFKTAWSNSNLNSLLLS